LPRSALLLYSSFLNSPQMHRKAAMVAIFLVVQPASTVVRRKRLEKADAAGSYGYARLPRVS